ncbi:hypothetical protein DJ030_14150 [bacterium endosymbiont of Escarpia laminata]|nr:MAG: hypothetical protein DJ030_14150 [bacterium endosymbiont of Escarpia laminata]RLJ21924.1 MAG: hypothetical protein DJ031_02025 [bacterium endosymbiont of Escarpia laminata]
MDKFMELGHVLAELLLKYPAVWPLYLAGLYFLILKPILRNMETQRLKDSTLREFGDSDNQVPNKKFAKAESVGIEVLSDFFRSTQNAWASGELHEYFGENPKNVADDKTDQEFAASFQANMAALEFAFKDAPPRPNEYLIDARNSGVRTSYVLTNTHFYCFGLDKGILANNYDSIKVPLNLIESCEAIKGMVFTKLTLTLKSGEVLHIKDIMDDLPGKYIEYYLANNAS